MKTYNDVFVEELVVRHTKSRQLLQKAAFILAGFALVPIFAFIAANFFPGLGAIVTILELAAIAGGVFAATHLVGLEYEYSFFSGDVEIDQITARRKRKNLINFACRDIELMAPSSPEFGSELQGQYELKIDARGMGKGDKDWFIICRSESGKRSIIVFSPSERMIGAFKKFVKGGKLKES